MSTVVTEQDFRCPICDTKSKWSVVRNDKGDIIEAKDNTSNWENVDQYRLKKVGMNLCKTCGMVAYPLLYKDEKEIIEFYRKDYRKAPQVANLYTGERKLHMHHEFLKDYIKEWKTKDDVVLGEVGSAFGMVLHWLKQMVPQAKVYGTELTTTYKRVCYHEFGIELDDELDLTQKYDMIMSYKVQEHMQDPDVKLRSYVEALKPDGIIYISVPCWFDKMYNFGKGGFDPEYYYSTNHINVWTKKLFETMLKKCGLEIVRQDSLIYDETYICKRNDDMMTQPREYEDPKKIKWSLERIFQAWDAFDKQDYVKAIELWPNYPMAWQGRYEANRKKIHAKGWDDLVKTIIEPMLKHCYCVETVQLKADLQMRYNRWGEAMETLNEVAKMKPGAPAVYVALHNCYANMSIEEGKKGNGDLQIEYLCKGRDVCRELQKISLQMKDQGMDWAFWYHGQIPTPKEIENRRSK